MIHSHHNAPNIPFFTLLLMISFASVNAVLFTPALPDITNFFSISAHAAQSTMTWFLAGYAIGQLIYGPLANRFGRKRALYIGISLQIASSLLCVFSGIIHEFFILVIGRLLLAIGSGVGLKITFTLVNESYEPKLASQKISYLMLAFAITPGLGVALGGILNEHFGWMSCFYAGAIYGVLLFLLVLRLPETLKKLDLDALQVQHILHKYAVQFKNAKLIAGGVLMGLSGSFVYLFAAAAPFIAINLFGMSSSEYGFANMLPLLGLIIGSLTSAQLAKIYQLKSIVLAGIFITGASALLMLATVLMHLSIWFCLFVPMGFIYFGLCFILSNTSAISMGSVSDKAHGSAVLNFLNVGLTALSVVGLGFFHMQIFLLPSIYIALCFAMVGLYPLLMREKTKVF